MTEEQIAQLLVQIADEMRKAEEVKIDWQPEFFEAWDGPHLIVERTGRRWITITIDMPKAVH